MEMRLREDISGRDMEGQDFDLSCRMLTVNVDVGLSRV